MMMPLSSTARSGWKMVKTAINCTGTVMLSQTEKNNTGFHIYAILSDIRSSVSISKSRPNIKK